MIDSIKRFFNDNKKLLISISIYLLMIFLYYKFIIHKYFTLSNDAVYQYNLFYEEWIRIVINFLKTGKFNTYSFNMFLGTDFYSSMGYYCIGDIFLPLLLLFRNNIRVGLLIETIICVFISGLSMKALLKKIHIRNENVIIFISLIYAVAGQGVWMVQDHMFHRFYSFLPLLFYSVFVYFESNKKSLFIVISALLFMQCYYFMFPTLIFLFLFCLFELIKEKKKFKDIIYKFFDLLLGLLIGFAISAIVCLPSIVYVLNIVGEREAFNSFSGWLFNSKMGIFLSYIVMNPINVIPSLFNSAFDYNEECFNLFITIVPMIFSIHYLFKKNNRPYLIMMIILQLICFIKPLNSIMHGFATPSLRWLFLLEFYVLYLAAKGLDEYNKEKDKKILMIIFGIITIVSVIFLIILVNYRYEDLYLYHEHIRLIIVGLIFESIIYIVFNFNQKCSFVLSILFVLLSTLYISGFNASDNTSYIKTLDVNELNRVENDNDLYFRHYYSYEDSYDGLPLDMNSSLVNCISTTSSYNTMYETKIDRFLDLSKSRMMLDWIIEVNDPNALDMLGVKYYISKNNNLNAKNSNLEYIGELNNYAPPTLYIYQNKNYKGFGFTNNKLKYTDKFSNASDFIDYVMVDDNTIDISLYKELSKNQLILKEKDNNHIKAEITLDSNNILFVPLPNNEGWKIKVNGSLVKPISVNGGFIGLVLDKGYNNIDMIFHTPYLTEGMVISCIGVLLFIFIYRKERKV